MSDSGGLRRDFVYRHAWASEQLGAVAESLAHPAAVFYAGLRSEGIDEAVAIKLTGEFVGIMLRDVTKP